LGGGKVCPRDGVAKVNKGQWKWPGHTSTVLSGGHVVVLQRRTRVWVRGSATATPRAAAFSPVGTGWRSSERPGSPSACCNRTAAGNCRSQRCALSRRNWRQFSRLLRREYLQKCYQEQTRQQSAAYRTETRSSECQPTTLALQWSPTTAVGGNGGGGGETLNHVGRTGKPEDRRPRQSKTKA